MLDLRFEDKKKLKYELEFFIYHIYAFFNLFLMKEYNLIRDVIFFSFYSFNTCKKFVFIIKIELSFEYYPFKMNIFKSIV